MNMARYYKFTQIMDPCIPDIVSNDFIQYLIEHGFFKAPSSIKYHGNYTGGLFDHCMAVTKILCDYTRTLPLTWSRPESPLIVGMFHDLCKLDEYVYNNGTWEYKPHNAKLPIPGHGEKSVILLQQHVKLTDEELFCIRWHMGAFDEKENWSNYSRACGLYPNVLYTHTADMAASQIAGV